MTDTTPSEQRRALINACRQRAERLLPIAKDPYLKQQLGLAISDLDEALGFLEPSDVDGRPHVLMMVDLATNLAMQRTDAVQQAIDKYGPDVVTIG